MSVDRRQPLSAAVVTIPDATKTPLWGIGLSAIADVSDNPKEFTHYYCQQPEPQGPDECPGLDLGKRSYSYSMSKTLTDAEYGTSAALSGSATSNLGTQTYSLNASASGNHHMGVGISADGTVGLSWADSLTVKSSTLKYGTPVTLSVSLVVTPTTTSVSCTNDITSYGQLIVEGPGVDASGGQLEIEGRCTSGTFEYYFDNDPGQPQGTTQVGTLTANVGEPYGIGGGESAQFNACTAGYLCVGQYNAALVGSVKWSITGITSGATYTTASGNTYQ